jgi:uncharacterized protein YdeI (YjbR/CyaY-like superfamily)
MVETVEAYFSQGCGRCPRFATADCATRRWATALQTLRAWCLEQGLAEELRWGHPCYRTADRNVVLLSALRDEVRLSFFDAAALPDPTGLLQKPGPHSQQAHLLRFTSLAEVQQRSAAVLALLQAATALAQTTDGPRRARKPSPVPPANAWPPEWTQALAQDPELAAAFQRLTPGRQRSVHIHLSSAKKPATRQARIQALRPLVLAGQGADGR